MLNRSAGWGSALGGSAISELMLFENLVARCRPEITQHSSSHNKSDPQRVQRRRTLVHPSAAGASLSAALPINHQEGLDMTFRRTIAPGLRNGVGASCIVLATLGTATPPLAQAREHDITRIGHIIVIYQENWSFDSLYGLFPGADGLANAFGQT